MPRKRRRTEDSLEPRATTARPEYRFFTIRTMSARDWSALGLRAPVARAAHRLAQFLVASRKKKQTRINAEMRHFAEQLSLATEHEKLILQDVIVFSDVMKQAVTNGCGPEGFGYLVPDFCFLECCDGHDECYARGGSEGDRFRCDLEFYECMKRSGPDWLASYYYWGVRTWAQGSFNYTQACRGICEQTEYEVVNLGSFRTLDRNGNTILNTVTATSRQILENKAREQSRIVPRRPCKQGCDCQANMIGAWDERPTVLSIALRTPGGDLQGYARCDGTMRARTLSGRCVKP